MKPLTRDQSDVLKALAMHGGGAKTRSELTTYSGRVDRMRAARRDGAVSALVGRGFARPAHATLGGTIPARIVDGWAITAEGLVALQREGVGA